MSNYAALAAVFLGLITAVLGLVTAWQGRNAAAAAREISVKVDGNLSDVIARVAQLTGTLHDANVAVPPPAAAPGKPPADP